MILRQRPFLAGFLAGCGSLLLMLGLLAAALLATPYVFKDTILGLIQSGLEPPDLPTGEVVAPWTFVSAGGEELRLEEQRGKVVFLTVFNPSCYTCLAELPFIQNLYDELADEPVVFIVATNQRDLDVKSWALEHKFMLPVYFYDEAPAIYTVRSVPSTFIVGPDGRLAYGHKGALKWDDPACVEFIRGLLVTGVAEPPASTDPAEGDGATEFAS